MDNILLIVTAIRSERFKLDCELRCNSGAHVFSRELTFSIYQDSSFACHRNSNSRYYVYNRSGGVLIMINLG